MPETRVKQMQHSVLGAADVQINPTRLVTSHPIALGVLTNETFIIVRVAKSQVIPARACPLRHRVCLAYGFLRISNPFLRSRQRWFARANRLVVFQWRWNNRQLGFIESLVFSIFPNDRERLAPI